MIKNKSLCVIFLIFLFSGCNNNTTTLDELKKAGYKSFNCEKIDYFDSKSDLAEDPFFKIYSTVSINDPSLSIIIARCFYENNCVYEIIKNNEVICQKYIVLNNKTLVKTWINHDILVFNAKAIL